VNSYEGSYQHTLDEKGRVSIPAEMRKASGDVFVLSRGLDECLYLYPLEEWELVDRELRELRQTSAQARRYVRQMLRTVRRLIVDGHGRVTIPQWHRSFADLESDVLINGALDHIELWNPQRFEEWEKSGESFEATAETVWKHARSKAKGTEE
jgi:MraZ protein